MGFLSSITGISKIVSAGIQLLQYCVKKYEEYKFQKSYKRIEDDPTGEFMRKYGGLRPEGNPKANTAKTKTGKHD